MKQITLLVAVTLLAGTTMKASTVATTSNESRTTRFSLDEPITFIERGISFYVFPNGEFDFNTETSTDTEILYRTNGRRSNNQPQGVRIERDASGKVRRVGNVFINYDFQNRIKRIGTVYMSYNRFALSQVGGLKIIYNRRGEIVNIFGSVKGYTFGHDNCNEDFDFDDNQNQEHSQYYYRQNGNRESKK